METALKRLLIYVWSEIVITLKGKHDKKTKIEICSKINELYLGKLLELLEEDLSSTKRESLLINDGNLLFGLLNRSEDFADFKRKLTPYITPKTVWEQVNIILKNPTEYSHISGQLKKLKELRDMAAHHHIILQKDLKDAEKYSEHILSTIANVRNDYYEELLKSIQSFAKTMNESLKKFPSEAISRVISENTAILSDTLNRVVSKMIKASQMETSLNALNETVKKNDWKAIGDKLRSNNPEMKNILERFDNNDANSVVKEMQKELDEEINNSN